MTQITPENNPRNQITSNTYNTNRNLDQFELTFLNKINNSTNSVDGERWNEQLMKYREQKQRHQHIQVHRRYSIVAFLSGIVIVGSSFLYTKPIQIACMMSFGSFITGTGLYQMTRSFVEGVEGKN
jgi:hypothetical protein